MTLNELKQKMDEARYIYDDTLATVLFVALQQIVMHGKFGKKKKSDPSNKKE